MKKYISYFYVVTGAACWGFIGVFNRMLAQAVEATHAKNVFILPNNTNIILAAQQASELTEKNQTTRKEKLASQLILSPRLKKKTHRLSPKASLTARKRQRIKLRKSPRNITRSSARTVARSCGIHGWSVNFRAHLSYKSYLLFPAHYIPR